MSINHIRSHTMFHLCKRTLKVHECSLNSKITTYSNHSYLVSRRNLRVDSLLAGTAGHAETTSTLQGLSKLQAQELVLRLNDEERSTLTSALHEYRSKLIKDEYEAESVPRPTTRNLIDIAIANSIPFVGFGFLDNFFMLFFGDYIDLYLGSYFCLTTMGAAALGNTLSDIIGIGSAFYVERMANRVGFSPPKLSPVQMDMNCSRNAANFGRVLGVTIGCFLGMCPLLFRKHDKEEEPEQPASVSEK
ncbi:transmembrane protein 65-like isoform X2 [Dendroctonus ponderosae]|uniref:transmembrane protein 65 isoform X2 n=1 Tax=Dendroctonus ponderosae TaxID=77166 RepID=UPI0020356AA0|nr:transmembrane protein 65 isoform X2 [Dendroctonus ponderosae]XP_048522386.1 transmembrane protein 65-like isoform X2 [Dendroctonus ponderosae]XP_048522512.1 transmembrane protein 65-like isoform X2 [Dendroctonus ponderosae]